MTADALIKATHPGRPENILYIIQQAVEKTLRAAAHSRREVFLFRNGLDYLSSIMFFSGNGRLLGRPPSAKNSLIKKSWFQG